MRREILCIESLLFSIEMTIFLQAKLLSEELNIASTFAGLKAVDSAEIHLTAKKG